MTLADNHFHTDKKGGLLMCGISGYVGLIEPEPSDFLAQEEIERMGITQAAEDIYFCTKQ
jgi:hypothetical protein